MKKVSVVGTVGVPACYGGFETLVDNLIRYNDFRVKYEVFCSTHNYKKKNNKYHDADLVYIPLKANGIQSVIYDILSLLYCLFNKSEIILILGVSGCIFLPIFRMFSDAKIVTNIDGIEWRRDKWGRMARLFLKLSERIAVNYSDVIIADNQAIGDYVDKEYGKQACIIAYGGDHAISMKEYELKSEEYFLSICRIEPENNIDMILEAFSGSECKLKFIGNWASSEYGRMLRVKYEDSENIEMLDPIYDINKLFKLRGEAKAYVHGHSAGGTNPSLVEAMYFSIPIFAFDCNFNINHITVSVGCRKPYIIRFNSICK